VDVLSLECYRMLSFIHKRLASSQPVRSARPGRCRPAVEPLEDRLVPYALSGYQWANPNVSVSFMPDGTLISSSYPSNLFGVYNAAYPQATWQREVARALQVWADVSNLNFHFVADNGAPQGTAGLAQGDSRFGDIRIGGYSMGSGILGLGWNPNSTTTGGDVELSTTSVFPIGSMPDLASVVMHEVGHGIGFNHSLVDPAVMEGGLWGTYPGPYADDIAGVQAMYGARKPDVYDAAAANNTLGTATALTLSYGGTAFQADITTMADVDYYKVTAPAGTDGTLTVSVDARNLSLFDPKVSVYNASGTLLATASASTYGDVATVNLTGLVAGQVYYLEASGATADAFGMGAYKLSAQFGGFTPPTIGPDAFEPNNTVSTATNFGKLSSKSQTSLTLHTSTDVDYYTFVAASKGTYAVSITPTQGSGTLSLTVLNAQQAVLATGQSQTGGVTVSASLASGARYYIKVSSPTGSLFAYTLTIGTASAGGGGGGGAHKLVPLGVADAGNETQGDFFYQNAADDPENARSGAVVSLSELSPSLRSAAEFLAATTPGVAQPVASVVPNQASGQGSPAAALVNWGPQAAVIVSARVPVGMSSGTASAVVPNLWPAVMRSETDGGDGTVPSEEMTDAAPWPVPVSTARPAARRDEPDAIGGGSVDVWQRVCGAGFADGSPNTDSWELGSPGDSVAAEKSASVTDAIAAAALAVVLGGCAPGHRAEPERRTRRAFEF
jgi:hypothetical protein